MIQSGVTGGVPGDTIQRLDTLMKVIFAAEFYKGYWRKKRGSSSIVVYLFQQSKQDIQFQHNKFNKARQPEGQMPIMLATYGTNKIIVSATIC